VIWSHQHIGSHLCHRTASGEERLTGKCQHSSNSCHIHIPCWNLVITSTSHVGKNRLMKEQRTVVGESTPDVRRANTCRCLVEKPWPTQGYEDLLLCFLLDTLRCFCLPLGLWLIDVCTCRKYSSRLSPCSSLLSC
jgi:hypothetical protein